MKEVSGKESKARDSHRFFLPEILPGPQCSVDLAPLAHQLRNVLRLAPGSMITLLDGSGTSFLTEIVDLDDETATGRVVAQETVQSEPGVVLTLYQCALKRDRFEWVLQKGTELGVNRFVPVISSRTVVRPAAKLLPRYDRWRAIIREAAEQSRRGRLPVLDQPLRWEEALDHGAGQRLLAWEEEEGADKGLATVLTNSDTISLLIGPEGGITGEEAAAAISRGWQCVSLGPRVLRAETAAVAAAAVVMHLSGSLG